jgi:hypothetical protein
MPHTTQGIFQREKIHVHHAPMYGVSHYVGIPFGGLSWIRDATWCALQTTATADGRDHRRRHATGMWVKDVVESWVELPFGSFNIAKKYTIDIVTHM